MARVDVVSYVKEHRRDGVVVGVFAVGRPGVHSPCRVIPKDYSIYSFPAWRSSFMGGCGEQAGKLACCVLGQGT